jgi:hypothetical protein
MTVAQNAESQRGRALEIPLLPGFSLRMEDRPWSPVDASLTIQNRALRYTLVTSDLQDKQLVGYRANGREWHHPASQKYRIAFGE